MTNPHLGYRPVKKLRADTRKRLERQVAELSQELGVPFPLRLERVRGTWTVMFGLVEHPDVYISQDGNRRAELWLDGEKYQGGSDDHHPDL